MEDTGQVKEKKIELQKSLSFIDVVILAFSTMIGWGWVVLTGDWIIDGGSIGAVIAFVLGAILCIFVGITYCELTPMLPYAGGEMVFSYKALGYDASWFTGWMIAFAYIGVAAWEGPALATAIDYLIPIPRIGYLFTIADFDVYISWLVIPSVVGLMLIFFNFKGINISAKFQVIVTGILALGGIIFAGVSTVKGNIQNLQPSFTDTKGVFSVMLAVPAMFVGFDVIPQITEEMKIPAKKIPIAIISSICLAASWYIIIILSAAIAAPREILAQNGISVANAIVHEIGKPIAGKLIILTAIMGILTSWNGFIMGSTRVLYSMGRARMLPKVFGRLHPRYKTPYIAIIFVGVLTIVSPILGKNSLSWFVNASAFGTVIAYFMVSLSFVILRYRFPDEPRPYKIRYGIATGYIAILVSLFFIALYLPIGSSSLKKVEWVIVLCWLTLGLIQYVVLFKNRSKYREERERVMNYKWTI